MSSDDVYDVIRDDLQRIVDSLTQAKANSPIWVRRALEMEVGARVPTSFGNVFYVVVIPSALQGEWLRIKFEAPPDFELPLDTAWGVRTLGFILSRYPRGWFGDEDVA